MQDKSNMHLSVIIALKKICNHPSLLVNDKESSQSLFVPQAMKQKAQDDNFIGYCGKITVVRTLMRNLRKTDEKLVLVSYYIQTLDLLETVCGIEGLKFSRLDGTTLSSARSKIIEQFNTRTDESSEFRI
jgi:SNF2 family DNA or RNA helicase